MQAAWLIIAFAVGASVGSFINVVSFRYNTGLSLWGRSVCLSCGRRLSALDLVPLFGWIALRGRCRTCRAAISAQYPLVELLTGLLFAGIALKAAGSAGDVQAATLDIVFQPAAWSLLLVILLYDLKHKIIPDEFVFAFIGISAAHMVAANGLSDLARFPEIIQMTLAGPILFLPFALLWLVSQGRWIGLGDGKLVLGFGWMLGLSRGISAVLLGFWSGAVFSVLLMLASKFPTVRKALPFLPKYVTGKTEIPFAPFLILGYALVYFFELSAISF